MGYLGVYDRTIFYSPTSKYCVISVKTSDRSVPQEARSAYRHRDHLIRFVAVGYGLPLTDKVSMILDGDWQNGKHGYQLQVKSCEEIVPQTKDGIQGYLSSHLIKGVGEKTAALIVERFGADSLNVLENEPERLLEIKGITREKLDGIVNSCEQSRSLRDLMILLSPFNVTPVTAAKIYEYFGAKSVEILQNDPYELCRISGFGFKRVDAIVLKGDCKPNAPMRIHGAIFAALDTQKNDNGHLFLSGEKLLHTASKLLNEKLPEPQINVSKEEIDAVLKQMILKGEVVSSDGRIYQTKCFVQEDETACKIAKMLSEKTKDSDVRTALASVRDTLGITLSQKQTEAVYMAFRSKLSIITGGPGTGKTTVLRAVIKVFEYLYPKGKILLAAPTGRASRRMAESTRRKDASTLHSLLGLVGDSEFIPKGGKTAPLEADLIIIDESSMVDMWLADRFFSRIDPKTLVVLVGDADQLQSVGAGDVFRELINCGNIPVTRLGEIFRQKKDSLIAYNAQSINAGQSALTYGEDFRFMKCTTQQEAASVICDVFCDRVSKYGIDRVQILSPFRSEGEAAVDNLNIVLREMVNPVRDDMPDLKVGGKYFRCNDKVMQTKNSTAASNGDIGFIQDIRTNDKGDIEVVISFGEDRTVKYGMEDMANVELAYATTVHKAMGSEYDVVILPIIRSHAIMLKRTLIYTAITRAKRKVILIGQKGMLIMAIGRNDTGVRNTALGERINNYLKVQSLHKSELKQAS